MKNKKLVIVLIILILIASIGLLYIANRNKTQFNEVEEQFTKSIASGNCAAAYDLFSSKLAQSIPIEDFQDRFCKVLKDKKLSKVYQTSDDDLDAEIGYSTAYEISPAPANNKYLIVRSMYFYESETIENVQFLNSIDNLPKR
jgi:hypothetical protein